MMIVAIFVVVVFVFVIVRMRMIIRATVTVFENLHKLRTIFFTKSDSKIEVQKIRRPASN
jgi:hypothetical protein